MQQVNPGQIFPITRQLSVPGDTDTYYLQSKVYDSISGSLLATVNLTDLGGQLFSGTCQAPGDSTGAGKFIHIVTSVYTDAGRTTYSPNYDITDETVLVQQRLNSGMLGGGQGDGWDLKDLDKVMRKAMKIVLHEVVPKIVRMEVALQLSKLPEHRDLTPEEVAGIITEQLAASFGSVPFDTFATKAHLEQLLATHHDSFIERHDENAALLAEGLTGTLRSFHGNITDGIQALARDLYERIGASGHASKTDYEAHKTELLAAIENLIAENVGKMGIQVQYPHAKGGPAAPRVDWNKVNKLYREGVRDPEEMQRHLSTPA